MQFQYIPSFSLLLIIIFLILSQSKNGISTDTTSELYQNCGAAATAIGYPFRGINNPDYCGHPSLVLSCDDQNNITNIDIMSVKYRLLEIEQSGQIMRIVREDMTRSICPTEMANTTLDYSVFDYAASYMNYTFLYGCSFAPEFSIPLSCGACMIGPLQGCNASVVVPGPVVENGVMNVTEFEESLENGFVKC